MAFSSNSFDFGSFFQDIVNNPQYKPHNNSHYSTSDENIEDYDDSDYDELKRNYNQLKEDFDSYRKRVNNSIENEKNKVKFDFLKDFLNNFVLYTIEVYKAKKEKGEMTDEDMLILSRLNTILDKYGVHPMDDSVGKPFDHNTMEAIYSDHNSIYETDGIVTKVFSNGFMIGDKEVLIHQKVGVSAV